MNFLENIIKLWHKHYDLFAEGEDMNNILFTIGHSQHEISYFIESLRKYEINYILYLVYMTKNCKACGT